MGGTGGTGGAASDAGSEAGTPSSSGGTGDAGCGDMIPGLTKGAIPPLPSKTPYFCGQSGPTSTTIDISNAVNGTPYVVAVAAFDNLGNVGPLSGSLCGTPYPTDTFFGEYCKDGGGACQGGCGQCTAGPSTTLAWPALATSMLALAGLGARRARGRRSPKASRRSGESA